MLFVSVTIDTCVCVCRQFVFVSVTIDTRVCVCRQFVLFVGVTIDTRVCVCVCRQFVLFVGVTILLASTYVTMTTQEKLVQQEPVIRVARPIDQHLDSDSFDLQLRQLRGT